MQKNELRKLRALPATKEMMQKGKKYTEKDEMLWTGKKRHVIIPEYDVLMRVQNLKQYIKIAVFLPEDMRSDIKTPRYEIFLNVEGQEYITRELDAEGKEVHAAWESFGIFSFCESGGTQSVPSGVVPDQGQPGCHDAGSTAS